MLANLRLNDSFRCGFKSLNRRGYGVPKGPMSTGWPHRSRS